MIKTKTFLLIFFLIVILALILFVRVRKPPPTPKIVPEPTAIATPKPTSQLIPTSFFTIMSTNISGQTVGVTELIKIRFSEPVSGDNLFVKITPESKFLLLFDPSRTELTISPSDAWAFDTSYNIKILKITTSTDNQPLDKDYEFNFKTIPYSGI